VIERHMIEIGFLPARPGHDERAAQVVSPDGRPLRAVPGIEAERPPGTTLGLLGPRLRQCPKCGEAALIRLEDCDQCTSCGYSKCG
jgi:ribonucleoside-diphosphate reductase alpha chain